MDLHENAVGRFPLIHGLSHGHMLKRSRFLDGTSKTFFAPGQELSLDETSVYTKPTAWPAAGSLLRVPKVVRFLYAKVYWTPPNPGDPDNPLPPDPNPAPTGTEMTGAWGSIWTFGRYKVTTDYGGGDVTHSEQVFEFTALTGRWIGGKFKKIALDPQVAADYPTPLISHFGPGGAYTRISELLNTGTGGTWITYEYTNTTTRAVTYTTNPSPAPPPPRP